MATKNSVTTSIQPFRFPDTDTEAYKQSNAEIELMLPGLTHTTLVDAQIILQANLTLPSNERSLRNVRRISSYFFTSRPSGPSLFGDTLYRYTELLLPVGYTETFHVPQINSSLWNLSLQVPCNRVQKILEVARLGTNSTNFR